MTPTDPQANASARRLILGAIVVVFAIIGTCSMYFLAPRGDRVGAIDLTAPAPLTVQLAAGRVFNFRLDATLPSPRNENSTRAKHNAVYDTLGESQIVVTATREGRRPIVARCAAYDGRATSASDTDAEIAVRGIPLTCSFGEETEGRYALTATVTWARGVTARHAVLEVRVAKP